MRVRSQAPLFFDEWLRRLGPALGLRAGQELEVAILYQEPLERTHADLVYLFGESHIPTDLNYGIGNWNSLSAAHRLYHALPPSVARRMFQRVDLEALLAGGIEMAQMFDDDVEPAF